MPRKTQKAKNKSLNPTITVITPSYNQGNYIEETIKSVVSQGYQNLEYLIFDGGSTDQTISIVRKYAKKYPQIKWVSQADAGQVDAINRGLKQAKGEIIAYLNSDDYYLPDTLHKVADSYQKSRWLWLVGNCQVTGQNLAWSFKLKQLWPIERSRGFLGVFNTVNQPAVFLTKKLINKVGLFDQQYHYAFDYDYWLRSILLSLPYRLKTDLSVFRIHSESKGNTSYKKQFKEDMDICLTHTNNLVIQSLHWLAWKTTLVLYSFLK